MTEMPRAAGGLQDSLEVLIRFLGEEAFTERIARLEYDLSGIRVADIPALLARSGLEPEVVGAAFHVRDHLGRLNDLIHASSIALALPRLLHPEEQLLRPSLAAGNDPSRPFDVETNRRVCEFKLARWRGTDAMRKRQVFKDFVHLAADQSGRQPELYVLGERPSRFLHNSIATAGWALDRSPRERRLFEERFGSLDRQVHKFAAAEGKKVRILDLETILPDLFGPATGPAGKGRTIR